MNIELPGPHLYGVYCLTVGRRDVISSPLRGAGGRKPRIILDAK